MPNRRFGLILLPLWITAAVTAQPIQSPQPVDQAVGDLDLLATSLRQVEAEQSGLFANISVFTAHDDLFAPTDPFATLQGIRSDLDTRIYSRVGPGFHARFSRPEYLVPITHDPRDGFELDITPPVDGAFLELMPPDTIFDLRPKPQSKPLLARPARVPAVNPYRIDGTIQAPLIEGRIEGRINGQVEPRRKDPSFQELSGSPDGLFLSPFRPRQFPYCRSTSRQPHVQRPVQPHHP